MDNKHGFYFLRVGTDNDKQMKLKVKIFAKGNQVQTSEKGQQILVEQQPDESYMLTGVCELKPETGKKTCDFLVAASHHEKTEISLE